MTKKKGKVVEMTGIVAESRKMGLIGFLEQ
jgi:hypothetical protein